MNYLKQSVLPTAAVVLVWCAVAVVIQGILARTTKWPRDKIYAVSLVAFSVPAALIEWYLVNIYAAIGMLGTQVVIAAINVYKLQHKK